MSYTIYKNSSKVFIENSDRFIVSNKGGIMEGYTKLINRHGMDLYLATIIDKATGAVLQSATFFSDEMARTWIMVNIKR